MHEHSSTAPQDLALLSDILPTGYHGAVTAGVGPGSTVFVAGAGPVGLAAATSCHLLVRCQKSTHTNTYTSIRNYDQTSRTGQITLMHGELESSLILMARCLRARRWSLWVI